MPHPSQANSTLLKQEAVVTVHGIPLSSYFEDFLTRTISLNSNKVFISNYLDYLNFITFGVDDVQGRQAMEYVIGKINSEVQEFANKTVKSVDELMHSKRSISDLSDEFTSNPAYHFQGPKQKLL